MSRPTNHVDVFLNDDAEPIASYRPPLQFDLDTSELPDGRHTLRIEAYDSEGTKGVREISFTVRNGPGIDVKGVRDNDVVDGKVALTINAFGGAVETNWEASRAETPRPVPYWAWGLLVVLIAFGLYYGFTTWNLPGEVVARQEGRVVAQSGTPPPAQGPGEGASQQGPTDGGEGDTGAAAAVAGFDRELGERVYGASCSSCHQANGQGLPGAFPPMAGDPVVLADDPTEHIDIILHGLQGKEINGVAYASPMPAFASQLSDEEIAAVINYTRTSWGNDSPLVAPEEVERLR